MTPTSAPAPYLDAEALTRAMTPARALAAVLAFYRTHRREDVAVPDRIHLEIPGRETVGLYMPAATREFVGVKLAHLMPQRTPNVEAEVFFYDAPTGRLLFWGDGKPLTALRTAAVSCAAALRLRPVLRRVLVFGTGVQARAHIRAFAAAYPALEEVRVAARSRESFERLRQGLALECPLAVRPALELRRDMAEAEAVITATPAASPLFEWRDAAPGTLFVAVGSATPHMNEVPPDVFLNGDVWLDSPRAAAESGDCLAAERAGWRRADAKGDLFDLLGDSAPPSLSLAMRSTLFKSAGHAAQDLALLVAIWKDRGGIGTKP